ncbi:MAG TPA: M14 family metallopeptidase [Candidatus Heimdallarchaeota archaeon]|nr:M14 family metallopeptidase [Candidatus Heimdallarchaeota archaeon]
MNKKTLSIGLLILFLASSYLVAQTSPEEFLGHKVGADGKLADYDQILAYFNKLDSESEKIKVLTIGETVLKKPMILAVITAEENMARLDEYKSIAKRLRDARDLNPEEAKQLAKQGKAIFCITCSQHATEIGASQMSLEFAYNLVTGKTPFDADKVLKDVIVILSPHINPDGHQMVTEWFRKYVGTKYEGGSMPWLYHHYAGHDNNRDWFMFNLPETQAVTKVLYHDWIPQIHIDEHQMGSTGARLFVPPFMNPPVPTVHPLVWRGVALCGTNMAFDLQKEGYSGVVYDRSYTGWWIGACDDTSWLHNSIGLLSEMASVRVAAPIYIDPTEVSNEYIEKQMQFPDPWQGGWWRLRDIVDYELVLSMSLVKTVYLHKEDFLFNFYKMCKDGIEKRDEGQPFAFVIPKAQRDYPTTLRMMGILRMGGVEVHQANADFTAGGKVYPAGSFVVLLSQPYRPYAQALLEKQKYPDIRQYPGGPPEPPYDNAGWTLPLQMGVRCEQIDYPFKADLAKLDEVSYPSISLPQATAPYIVLDSKKNASYSVIFALLKENAEVYRAKNHISSDTIHACTGSFIVKNTPQVQKSLPGLLEKWHVEAYGLDSVDDIPKSPLKNPRIGLYQSWRSNMDEGWTRFVFDDLAVPFTTLHNKDFKGTKKEKLDLKAKYDVIVFSDEDADMIKDGKPSPTSRSARYFRGMNIPPEYEGGIGKEGVDALKTFVEKGGILVTLNSATGLVFKDFEAPVSNALEKIDRTKFFCPTSLLKIKVDNSSPIGYGMPAEAAAMFSRSLAMSTRVPSGEWDRTVVASYPKEDVLLSGWLLGEDQLARKAAVVDLKHNKGHIVLIGFRCQHRAQSHGTYKFLLNALLYPQMD